MGVNGIRSQLSAHAPRPWRHARGIAIYRPLTLRKRCRRRAGASWAGAASCQPACKPGSVSRKRPGSHSSGTAIADRLVQPTRTTGVETPGRGPRRPYSVLLPVGFTLPRPLPGARWALTPPFHPYLSDLRSKCERRFAFCGTVPGVAPAGRYPAPLLRGARTFLDARLSAYGAPRLPGRLASDYLVERDRARNVAQSMLCIS